MRAIWPSVVLGVNLRLGRSFILGGGGGIFWEGTFGRSRLPASGACRSQETDCVLAGRQSTGWMS